MLRYLLQPYIRTMDMESYRMYTQLKNTCSKSDLDMEKKEIYTNLSNIE